MRRLYSTLLLVLLALALAGWVFWRYFYIATIQIDPLPTQATVSINGKPSVDRLFQVPAGSYQFSVGAPGYRTENFSITVGTGDQVTKRVELVNLPKATKLLDGPLTSVAASNDRKILYFQKDTSLQRYDLTAPEGSPAVPITPALTDVTQVNWSKDFALALLYKKDGEVGLYDFNRYDLLHQEYRLLDKGIKNSQWNPDASGLFYQFQTDAEYSLVKATRSGAISERLADLRNLPIQSPDLIMTTAPNNLIYFSSRNPKVAGDIFLFSTFERIFAPITESGSAYGPVVAPDGKRIVYLDNGELVAAEPNGKNKRNLAVRSKLGNYDFIDGHRVIVFASNSIAVVDTSDGSQQSYEVYAPSDAISSLIPDPNGQRLYYVYRGDLYRLDFKPAPTNAAPPTPATSPLPSSSPTSPGATP